MTKLVHPHEENWQFTEIALVEHAAASKSPENRKTLKKLVLLDDESLRFTEIDRVKLNRVATELREWLPELAPENDPFGFLNKDLLLVESALNGSLPLPYRGPKPHGVERREWSLPSDYSIVSAPFYNTIQGSHLVPPEIIERKGKRYAWANFEELGDEEA